MRIILTGASGFIGKKLVKSLVAAGHTLLALLRNPENNSSGDFKVLTYGIGDPLPLEVHDFSPEILIHLAWEGIPDFSVEMCLKNVDNQVRFLNHMKSLPSLKKVIVSGSCVEYGAKTGSCEEIERNFPNSYFSWSKLTLGNFYRVFCAENNINLVWFRLFYVYGPGQRPGSLIPTLINTFASKQEPKLNNPAMSNDYIYIDDVVDAFVTAVRSEGVEGIYNLGSGELTPVFKISSIIETLINCDSKYSLLLSEGIKDEPLTGFYADMTLTSNDLNWEPKWNILNGIKETYRLYTGIE